MGFLVKLKSVKQIPYNYGIQKQFEKVLREVGIENKEDDEEDNNNSDCKAHIDFETETVKTNNKEIDFTQKRPYH